MTKKFQHTYAPITQIIVIIFIIILSNIIQSYTYKMLAQREYGNKVYNFCLKFMFLK